MLAPAHDNPTEHLQPWRLILVVAIPFWLYAALARNLSLQMWLQGGLLSGVAPVGARIVQHAALLLLALPLYRWHLKLGFAAGQRWRQVLLAIGGGLLLSFAARPLLLLIVWAPDGLEKMLWGWRSIIPEERGFLGWHWAAANVDFALNYVCSVALMVGVQMYRELRAEGARRARAETAWRNARLEVLRSQFDPHFLFNALNTVANLSEQSPREVRSVIVKLSDLLRQSLIDRQREFVSVAHELEAVAAYMDIQRARFRERLRFTVNVVPEVLGWRLPCFILQPLLENAVRHGLGGDADAVDIELTLSAVRSDAGGCDLRIVIANTLADGGGGQAQLGLGLAMTRERLTTLLGPKACVVAEMGADGRFNVQLIFPSGSDMDRPRRAEVQEVSP
jgi:hypothetical protein